MFELSNHIFREAKPIKDANSMNLAVMFNMYQSSFDARQSDGY